MSRPELWLCRHGETEWSRDHRHTSRTDLPLTPEGEARARAIGELLAGVHFDLVLTSPLRRAAETAVLAGFPEARTAPSAVEWGYGDYEGLTTTAIRERVPGWTIWTGTVPGGESADEVGSRADELIERLWRSSAGRVALFSHAHFLRVLAARWVGQPPSAGGHMVLGTATVSVLGWEREAPVIVHWNVPAVGLTGSGALAAGP